MRILIFLLAAFPFFSSAQTRKQKPLVYKTPESVSFEAGDRIAMGTVDYEKVVNKYQKYSVIIPGSFAAYRDFLFAHPEMEYRIVVTWRQLGRKFPSLTETVTDSLFQYFRKPANSPDNRLYINSVYHAFTKDVETMKVDIEILSVKKSSLLAASTGETPFILPESHILYRNYKNELVIDTTHLPSATALWLEDSQLQMKYTSRGKAIAQLKRKRKETRAQIFTGKLSDKTSHGYYFFEVRDLPEPSLFADSKPLKELKTTDLKKGTVFTASYENGIFPAAAYTVVELRFEIAGKAIAVNGNKITAKVVRAIEAAPAGSDIVIRKVAVNGNRRVKYYDVVTLKKN